MNQFQEFFLQGSILDESVNLLNDRLKGLTNQSPVKVEDHELVFSSTSGPGCAPVKLHLRRSLNIPQPQQIWLLRYIGAPEPDLNKTCPVLVRKTVDTLATSNDLMQFLREIGFRLDYEYVMEGHVYTKGRMKVTVCAIFKVPKPGRVEEKERFPGGGNQNRAQLVQISAVVPYGQESSVAGEIKTFADELKPIVRMEKIDYSTKWEGQ
jgi:mediator of RNA polymerase II transcription subunit 18